MSIDTLLTVSLSNFIATNSILPSICHDKNRKDPNRDKRCASLITSKATGTPTNYSPSPKKEMEGKKPDIKKIVIVSNPDATPFGWAFHGFYDAKEFQAKCTGHSPI
jgi:hypothetical protein